MQPTFHRDYQPVQIEVLTPVAINSGNLLDPMRYTICKEDKQLALHIIDLEQWVMDNAEDRSLNESLENDRFFQVRKYLQDDLQKPEVLQQYSLARRNTNNPPLFKKFMAELGKEEESQNQLQIAEALHNPNTKRLLLAGSSIKGAIRTAVISYLDQQYNLRLKNIDPSSIQRSLDGLFGGITDHAFKSLRVQDAEVLNIVSRLVSADEKRHNPDNQRQNVPKAPSEVIAPGKLDGKETAKILTSLTLGFNAKSNKALTVEKQGGITQREIFDWPRLCAIVNQFYRQRFREEFDKFYRQPHLQQTGSLLEPIRQHIAKTPTDQGMLLRVGRYSHAESLSIINGSPQGRRIQGRMVGPGTTRTLADGIWPFGWILISPADNDSLKAYQDELQQETQSQNTTRQQALEKQQRRREEEQRQKLAEKVAAEEKERALKLEQERKEQEEAGRLAREQAKEAERREGLGWVGRYIEDQDLNKGVEILAYLKDSEKLLPDNESSEDSAEVILASKRELAQQILRNWQQSWTSPTHYQAQWIQELKIWLGEGNKAKTAKTWPNKKNNLPQWLEKEENWENLDAAQLEELREDVEKILKKKAAPYLAKLSKA
jgi:CRISPR-associated protein Csm5